MRTQFSFENPGQCYDGLTKEHEKADVFENEGYLVNIGKTAYPDALETFMVLCQKITSNLYEGENGN